MLEYEAQICTWCVIKFKLNISFSTNTLFVDVLLMMMNMITSIIDDTQHIVVALTLVLMPCMFLMVARVKGVSTFKALGI